MSKERKRNKSSDKKPQTPEPISRQLFVQHFEQIDGIYHGQIDRSYKKHGVGIFIHDSSMTYVGEWTNDQCHGQGLLVLPFGGYLLGQFQRNLLEGPGVLRMANSNIIVGYFHHSGLQGICFTYGLQSRMWSTNEYQRGMIVSRMHEEKGEANVMPKSMQGYPELQMVFTRVIKKEFLPKGAEISQLTMENGYLFIGYPTDGLGVVFHPSPLTYWLKIGHFKQKHLDGLGRSIKDNGDISDGLWEKSMLVRGFKYSKQNHQFIEVETLENEHTRHSTKIRSGTNLPIDQIVSFRARQHHMSKYFYEKRQLNFEYLDHYKKLSLEDFQRSVFVQKSHRSSLLVNPKFIEQAATMNTINIVDPFESTLKMMQRQNYLKLLDPPASNTKPEPEQKEQELLESQQSYSREDIKRTEETKQQQLEQQPSPPPLAIVNLNHEQVPSALKEKLFEPLAIINYENIRDNTRYYHEPMVLKSKHSKKRIFAPEPQTYQFRTDMQGYQQFLEINNLIQSSIDLTSK